MNDDKNDLTRTASPSLPGFGTSLSRETRSEPFINDFADDGEDFEEPERDTNYALGVEDAFDDDNEEVDDEALDAFLPDELEEADTALFEEQEKFLLSEADTIARNLADDTDEFADDYDSGNRLTEQTPEDDRNVYDEEPVNAWSRTRDSFSDTPQKDDYDFDDNDAPWTTAPEQDTSDEWDEDEPAMNHSKSHLADVSAERTWTEEEEEFSDAESDGVTWPIGLVAVGALALLLVVAGVYGIIQQRSAAQEQIRQLQASLATAAEPAELAASRQALQDEKAVSNRMSAQIEGLKRENQRLSTAVSQLEQQLVAQQAGQEVAKPAPTAPTVSKAPAKPAPVAAPAPAAVPTPAPAPTRAEPVKAATGGEWFVNFGSYGNPAAAQDWAVKLKPSAGKVIVAPSEKDGKTFYRVRVVNIKDKTSAQAIASELSSAHGLPKLWVGQQ